MIFQHHRFQIWNINQHPYKHDLTELPYSNDSLPPGNVQNAKQAMDWLFAVLYPNTQPAVATVGDLPLVGNNLNDYRVVLDDGDGKAASYRWDQWEGDVAPEWKKVYDMDWGEQSILSNFLNQTQEVYVVRQGRTDVDENGDPIVGILAGQSLYGGILAGSNLTLNANSGDGVGPTTGFVQFADNARPTVDSAFSLGTTTERFLNFWSDEANIATFNISTNQITSTIGTIDFDDENLLTTGTITSDTLTVESGAITDTTGLIDFDDENLTTTGILTAGRAEIDSIILDNNIISTTALTDLVLTGTGAEVRVAASDFRALADAFADNNLTVGLLTTTDTLDVTTSGEIGNITFAGDTISTLANPLVLDSGGAQVDVVQNLRVQTGFDFRVEGTNPVRISDSSITFDGGFGQIVNFGSLTKFVVGAGGFDYQATFYAPSGASDGLIDLGIPSQRWKDLAFTGDINDGTNTLPHATLMSFRDANVGVAAGMSLFWDGTKWTPSLADLEVDHGSISGLLDDDHTQYALLAGRAGGQTFNGGSGASDDLVLRSTSNATKGEIRTFGNLTPLVDVADNLGGVGFSWNDVYAVGQFFGLRFENVTTGTLPAAGNVGRAVFATDVKNIYIDDGVQFNKLSSDKYSADDAVTWDGVATSQTYTTSADIDDAREAIWQFLDNSNGFREVQGAVITKTQTQVTVTFTMPPPAGTYRLVGVG